MSHIFQVFLAVRALGALLLLAGSAQAADTFCTRPIRVALFEFGVLYRSDTNDGIDARLLKEMERRTGCAFERVFMPRARIWNELQAGSLDMATAAIPTPERKVYAYLLPYMQSRNVVLLRKQSVHEPLNQATFENSNLRMAVVRGFRHEAAYDTMVAKVAAQGRVVEAKDVSDLLRMLDKGMVDAVLSQPLVYRQYLDEEKIAANFVLRDWAPQDQSSVGAMMLARKSFTDEQAHQWDQLVADILRDGTLQQIARSFVSPSAARALIYTGPRSPD